MKRKIFHSILLVLLAIGLPACSTKKNTRGSRFYQAFTTRYNVYFNGNEHYKEQLQSMEKSYEDNFTEQVIYMHPAEAYNNPQDPQPSADFERTIEKCQKAIQLHSIKKKPKRNQKKMGDPAYKAYLKRDEYNPFIHNAWRLMGRAQYYKGDFLGAAATFLYITRHFTWKPELVAEAQIWQARCYVALDWLYEAEDVLFKVNNDKLPDSQVAWYETVYADYLIKKGEHKQAIPYLQKAIKNEPHKIQRSRMNFLLGQLYILTGEKALAYEAFEKVIKSSPPYRMEFNARIKQTEVFTGKNYEKVVKRLRKMTKRDRNKEYLNQLYYAIGNIYLTHQDTVNAIKNYQLAAKNSTRNGVDKAVNQITLGNLFFEQHRYVEAQPCYAEALPQLKESYPDYTRLSRRSEVLDELVVYAQNVDLQDSLQTLAKMPEKERDAAIQKIIDDLIKQEKEEAENQRREEYLAQQEGAGLLNSNNQPSSGMNLSGDKSWYFYNTTLVASGKSEFQKKWGSRKLEDDWRRRNKAGFSMDDFTASGTNEDADSPDNDEPGEENSPTEEEMAAANDPKKPEYYLKQLPLTPEEMQTSDEIIAEGLYNMALILKNRLEDYPASLETFGQLETRFPDNPYRLESYYNIYLMYMRMGKKAEAEAYRAKIRSTFPESQYAQAMADPDYIGSLRRMNTVQDSIYINTYKAYLENRNATVHRNYEYMRTTYPVSRLMPKFMFLDALSYIGEKKPERFKERLTELLETYPDADVSPMATDMLRGIAEGRKLAMDGKGNTRGMLWQTRLSNDTTATGVPKGEAAFSPEKNASHFFVMVFANDSVSSNQLLFDIAKHNFSNFVVRDFDLEVMTFNEIGMIIVKGFNNFDEVIHYRRILDGNTAFKLPEGVRPVIISEQNFRLLLDGYSFDDYFKFTEQNN